MTLTDATARWFQDRRGIDRATMEAFGIESEGEGVTFPYPDGAVKHRKTLEKGEDGRHKMWFDPRTPDGHQRLFLPPNFSTAGRTKIVWEGETDTMAAWQHAPAEVQPHICGIGGAGAFGDKGLTDAKIQEYFGDADLVFFVMDNEDPYKNAAAYETVERAKLQIKSKLPRKARFVQLPGSVQDGCEFFQTYDWAAFMVLLQEAKKVQLHFKYLDLTKDAPDYDWLVDNFLCKGDIAMLIGDGGVGKSWIATDLAVHMATGKTEWLGMKLAGTRAMILDQENPEVGVRQRLHKLGLRPEHADNLPYAWYQNIMLDNPETVRKLYDDVTVLEPNLLVVDSLSRVHMKNENENAEMNTLINGAIYPLSREFGVTVLLIHHTAKAGGSRGATAIRNATDLTLDVYNSEDEKYQIIRPDKLRSVAPWGHSLYTRRVEDDEGNITITTEEEELPI